MRTAQDGPEIPLTHTVEGYPDHWAIGRVWQGNGGLYLCEGANDCGFELVLIGTDPNRRRTNVSPRAMRATFHELIWTHDNVVRPVREAMAEAEAAGDRRGGERLRNALMHARLLVDQVP